MWPLKEPLISFFKKIQGPKHCFGFVSSFDRFISILFFIFIFFFFWCLGGWLLGLLSLLRRFVVRIWHLYNVGYPIALILRPHFHCRRMILFEMDIVVPNGLINCETDGTSYCLQFGIHIMENVWVAIQCFFEHFFSAQIACRNLKWKFKINHTKSTKTLLLAALVLLYIWMYPNPQKKTFLWISQSIHRFFAFFCGHSNVQSN